MVALVVARCMSWQRLIRGAALIALGLGLVAVPARAASTTPTLSGRLVDQNGQPVVATVYITYYLSSTDVETMRSSDHAVCVTQRGGRRGCGNTTVAVGTWWRDGSWSIPMPKGASVALPGRHAVDVMDNYATRTTAAIPAPYSESYRELRWSGRSISLGTHVLWRPAQSVERDDAGNVHLHLKRPAGAATPELMLFDQRPELIWSVKADANDDVTLDHHVLEQGTSSFRAITSGGSWRYSAPMTGLAGNETPVSRGVHCSTYDRSKALMPIDRCPFVDGDLGQPITPDRVYPKQACLEQCPEGAALIIDLGAVRIIDTIVWRRCAGCQVDVSLEGSNWQSWPSQTRAGDDFAVLSGTIFPTRYVRIHLTPTAINSLREVSVWDHPLGS
jgi:hypothetical protein